MCDVVVMLKAVLQSLKQSRSGRLVLLLVLLLILPIYGYAETFEVCIDHIPPRQIVLDGKEPEGRNIDVARAFSEEMGFEVVFTASIPFNRCLLYMAEGKTDLMVGLVQNAERDKYMAFVPITNVTERRLFSLEENNFRLTEPEDTHGLRIGMVKHYAYYKTLAPKLNKSLLFGLSTLEEGFDLLLKNKLDAVVVTDHTGVYLSKLFGEKRKIVPSELAFVSNKTANLAISKHSPAYKHMKAFRQAAERLKARGVLIFPKQPIAKK